MDELSFVEGVMIEDSQLCALGKTSAITAAFNGRSEPGAKEYRSLSGKTGDYFAFMGNGFGGL